MTHQKEFALIGGQRKSADRMRAETIKDAVGVEVVAEKLGANVRSESHGWRCDCPACKGEGTVKISAHGEAWHCEACGAQGDVIHFVETALGRRFLRACQWLEEFIESRVSPCSSTGNLFFGGASGPDAPRPFETPPTAAPQGEGGSDARSGLQPPAASDGARSCGPDAPEGGEG